MTYNNKLEKSYVEILYDIFEKYAICPTTYAFLKLNNISFSGCSIKKTLIGCSAEVLNPCTGFNFTRERLLNIIYYLVKEGHFSMADLEHCDWFFVDLLYEMLQDEFEKKNKQQEEENKRQEQEMANYQQMQDYQSRMMGNMSQGMPSMPSFN